MNGDDDEDESVVALLMFLAAKERAAEVDFLAHSLSQMTFSVPTLDFHKMDSFSQGFMSLEICQISHSHTPAGIISFRTSQSRNFF